MSSIPPNNLEQMVAWMRIFAEKTQVQLTSLKKSFLELKNKLEKREDKK